MPKDDRNLLDVLKFELEFLEQGGYGRLPREAWRARFIFEDSPTCMNFNSKDRELQRMPPDAVRTRQRAQDTNSLYAHSSVAERRNS